ncbi:MAG: hypothetical protein PHP59_02455 [Methanofollis sp.]|uniref:hypothetical protein n=1 Tax=Methanofollis sp. TaxID=2052835 RepID=UPI00260FB4F3|nr:hypothetical protein [Methanofollis sp.]MDD4254219.1 hypothetical protein [Methanofollis sp.]
MKYLGVLIFGIIVCSVGLGLFAELAHSSLHPAESLQGQDLNIVMTSALPSGPETAPKYRVIDCETFQDIKEPNIMAARENLPTEQEGLIIAEKILGAYSGIPDDAVVTHAETIYLREYNTTSLEETRKTPMWVHIIFGQELDGMPVVGPGAEIIVDLGENGKVLHVQKIWRTVEKAENVPLITAGAALEKLRKGETINRPLSLTGTIEINRVTLGYYAEEPDITQEYLTPAWIFYGTDGANASEVLCVSAIDG